MCNFCLNVQTGDDYNPLIQQKLDFGFFGEADVDVYLAGTLAENPVMVLGVCQNNGSASVESEVKISYCPICGKWLRVDM